MSGTSPERAMREFLRRGGPQQRGLDDLAAAVARRRRDLLQRHRLDGTLSEVRELLDQAVLAERQQLARDLDDDARFAEMRIGTLPDSTAAAVAELADYPWRSSDARAAYEQIKDLLGREVLDQRFAGLKQALEGATEQDRAAVEAMLRDLNDLLEAHRLGEQTDQQFADFMDRHGDFFPERPHTVDELLDALAARAAAASRMRNSLTPQQRDELDQLAMQAFGSPGLMQSLSRLDDSLRALRPGEDWGGSAQFDGEQGLGLGDGTGALQELAGLDALTEQLAQQHAGASLDDVDLDLLADLVGEDAAVDARSLAELERALRRSGLVERGDDGALRLSPRAMRQLGRALLRDAAERMSQRTGARELRSAGSAGERSGASRPWEFGDTEPWDVTRSLLNAQLRRAGAGPTAAALTVADVEVHETESRTQAAVALLVDTSFSMAIEGRWVPMKRTALALHHLVSTRFRGDQLSLIGFGPLAQQMPIEQLTGLSPEWDKGTNLHHALMLAGRHFRRHAAAQPVLLVVTDGEPTAHLEPGGQHFFDYPPHPLTLAHTVRELTAALGSGLRPRSSASATTRGWPGSSRRWHAEPTGEWWCRTWTTWARPLSRHTSAAGWGDGARTRPDGTTDPPPHSAYWLGSAILARKSAHPVCPSAIRTR